MSGQRMRETFQLNKSNLEWLRGIEAVISKLQKKNLILVIVTLAKYCFGLSIFLINYFYFN